MLAKILQKSLESNLMAKPGLGLELALRLITNEFQKSLMLPTWESN
jgi:hypothetical protein